MFIINFSSDEFGKYSRLFSEMVGSFFLNSPEQIFHQSRQIKKVLGEKSQNVPDYFEKYCGAFSYCSERYCLSISKIYYFCTGLDDEKLIRKNIFFNIIIKL